MRLGELKDPRGTSSTLSLDPPAYQVSVNLPLPRMEPGAGSAPQRPRPSLLHTIHQQHHLQQVFNSNLARARARARLFYILLSICRLRMHGRRWFGARAKLCSAFRYRCRTPNSPPPRLTRGSVVRARRAAESEHAASAGLI